MKVTFDTNVADKLEMVRTAQARGFEIFLTSVTNRELLPSDIVAVTQQVILETVVLDESSLGSAVLGSDDDKRVLEGALAILSNGSFPKPGARGQLTDGQRRQLRDAMIFTAHVKASHEILVTDDERGFIRHGRRERLQELSPGQIMTSFEFLREFGTERV